ncbi:MAG: AraC family transcriptional regulator [Burkholderiales bacterium]|nr:AraC family transcriptional regulator [Burkholderiales bacterium]
MSARIRSASLAGYVELASSLGLPAQRMLRESGIDPKTLANPEALIDVLAVRRLLDASAAAAGIEDFGLRLVPSRRLSNLGPISLVLREEPTGRQALETLFRYMRLLNESLLTRIEDSGDLVIIREEFLLSAPGTVRQSMELAVGVLFRILSELLGPGWEPRQVCFMHRPPRDLASHLRVFGRFVSFNADFNGIVCTRRDLERPIEAADPAMARIARQYLDSLMLSPEANIASRVRPLIVALLPGARCTVERVAEHLGVDRRTIHRHLARRGETFSVVLSAVRAELATRHIRDGNRPLGEIADLLGFSGLSAFSRWFRTVFGTSVREWRNRDRVA